MPSPERAAVKSKRLAAASARIVKTAGGPIDVAIVLGSGLAAAVLARIAGRDIAYAKLHAPQTKVAGHLGIARAGLWAGRRVVAFAGRAHLYQGHTPHVVTYLVRLAAATGARAIVLTNAAGGLAAAYRAGDVMLIADHLNLTGGSPIAGDDCDPFVDMRDAYAPRLRDLARSSIVPQGGRAIREGVYAGVRGPQYETPAEAEMLRRLGASAVGMSTVHETIAARRLGIDVLGLSLITNAIAPDRAVSHAEVLAASQEGSERIAAIVEHVLQQL